MFYTNWTLNIIEKSSSNAMLENSIYVPLKKDSHTGLNMT